MDCNIKPLSPKTLKHNIYIYNILLSNSGKNVFTSIVLLKKASIIILTASRLFTLSALFLENAGWAAIRVAGVSNYKGSRRSSLHRISSASPLSSIREWFCQLLDATHCEQSLSMPQQSPYFLHLFLVESSVLKRTK